MKLFFLLILTFPLSSVHAWGGRGHQIVGETSALLLALEPGNDFFKSHSYDFGFYNNVPDIVWKRPASYKSESTNHYMDLEIFNRSFKKSQTNPKEAYTLSRKAFEKKYPKIKKKAGRAFWRVLELNDALTQISKKLSELSNSKGKLSKPKYKKYMELQKKWLVVAGTLGHYVADLAQPLHVTENHNGQLTDQKGIHSYFETKCVNELYPQLLADVYGKAKKEWPTFKKENSKKSVLDLLINESRESQNLIPKVLAIDKEVGRKDLSKATSAYQKVIADRLVRGSLYLAEIYRRQRNWEIKSKRFYFFGTNPPHIPPGKINTGKLRVNSM